MMRSKHNPFDVTSAPLDGINLVEAGAGTGKTYNIVGLFVRLVLEKGLSADQILVVTFTEAATRELRNRIRQRLEEVRKALQEETPPQDDFLQYVWHAYKRGEIEAGALESVTHAVQNFDQAHISTIHSFARSVLQEHAFVSGAEIEMEFSKDISEWTEDACSDVLRNWYANAETSEAEETLQRWYLPTEKDFDSLRKQVDKRTPVWQVEGIDLNQIRQDTRDAQKKLRELENEWQSSFKPLFEEHGSNSGTRTSKISNFLAYGPYNLKELTFLADASTLIKKTAKPKQPELEDFLASVSHLFEKLERTHELYKLTVWTEFLGQARARFEDIKAKHHCYSYDDMLTLADDAIAESGQLKEVLRETYKAALIDEFQDTDPVQWRMFSNIFSEASGRCLYLIGDPKQAIYSFRGADISTYRSASNSVPVQRKFTLATNYRSQEELVAAVNELFQFRDERVFYTETPDFIPSIAHHRAQDAPVPRFHVLMHEHSAAATEARSKLARQTASEIYKLCNPESFPESQLADGTVDAGEITVLVNSHLEAATVKDALLTYDLKSVMITRSSVFSSEEAESLHHLLRAIIHPSDASAIATVLGGKLWHWTAAQIRNINENEEAWADISSQFSEWRALWEQRGFMVMMTRILREPTIVRQIASYPDGERMLTNFQHLTDLLEEERISNGFGPKHLWQRLNRLRNEAMQHVDAEADKLLLESDENLVRIMTVHNSKGLQFPIVFVPFACLKLPSASAPYAFTAEQDGQMQKTLDLTGFQSEHIREDIAEQTSEILRLFYVAVTRAERHCFFSLHDHTNRGKTVFSPIYWLFNEDSTTDFSALKARIAQWGETSDVVRAYVPELADIPGYTTSVVDATPKILYPAREVAPSKFPLQPSWLLTSYSRLHQLQSNEKITFDATEIDEHEDEGDDIFEKNTVKETESIFDFPRGARTGNCWHLIFEELDFTKPETITEITEFSLEKHGLEGDHHQKITENMVANVLKAELFPDSGLRLQEIPKTDTLRELHFSFAAGKNQLTDIAHILKNPDTHITEASESRLFVHGFIDLTIRWKGKYYILDYKSNHLGDFPEDYSPDKLAHAMQANGYDMQYLLYTLAIHRYLAKKIPDYSYDTHFGGVCYLFLRGVSDTSRNGLFITRPEWHYLSELDEVLQ